MNVKVRKFSFQGVAAFVDSRSHNNQITLQVVSGGLCCQSGVAIAELGDKNDDMLIAVAAVTVGY